MDVRRYKVNQEKGTREIQISLYDDVDQTVMLEKDTDRGMRFDI